MHNPYLQQLSEEWLIEATIDDMQQLMEEGKLTSRHLVLMYIDRIARIDKDGAKINSVLEINPDALQIAEALDAERKQTGPRGPLHGIPVLLKDNIDTHDKMHTSAGSVALANHIAAEDSYVAKQLRQAGAVILGKANMTEWANFMTEGMPSGYSSRGGQVLNPYNQDSEYFIGGSSSGSGASVAANLAAVAVGTETSGSIISPASQNSVVGIKPTIGLISRTGIIPIAHSQDTAGPIARTVTDAAILLGALAGIDDQDPVTATSKGQSHTDYTQFLDANGLQGARIGVVTAMYDQLSEEEVALMRSAVDALRAGGAHVIDDVEIPSYKENWGYDVLVYEFKPDLNHYLSNLGPNVPVHSLADVIAYNNEHADVALKYGQTILEKSQATSGTLTEAEYINNRERDIYLSTEQGIDYALSEHQLDALLFPANWGSGIACKAGYPQLTVPGGYTDHKGPLGITFVAGAFSEPTLIKLGYAFEQATKHRVAPKL